VGSKPEKNLELAGITSVLERDIPRDKDRWFWRLNKDQLIGAK